MTISQKPSPLPAGDWTLLEIAKLLVPVFASIIVFLAGLNVSNAVDRNKSLTDARLDIYKTMGAQMDQMVSYSLYVGRWKEFTPEDIIKRKRLVDETFYTYQPLFSTTFRDAYSDMMQQLIRTDNGPGQDAMLRTKTLYRHFTDPASRKQFTEEDNSASICASYHLFMYDLAVDFGLDSIAPKNTLIVPNSCPPDRLAYSANKGVPYQH